ncbi:MAG: hypothetical protein QOJ99_1022 [Bryobacterales bacterium]|jgi:hypothetical protein|nr:hypothetical protein [Bryobacterales bacterium]
MKHSLLVMTLVGVGLLNITNARAQAPSDSGAAVVVTGCLAQGEQPAVFKIQDSTGKIYLLMSSTVNMKPHLGHQVTITAVPAKGGAHDDKSSDTKSAQSDNPHLQVSDLKMVSVTCP